MDLVWGKKEIMSVCKVNNNTLLITYNLSFNSSTRQVHFHTRPLDRVQSGWPCPALCLRATFLGTDGRTYQSLLDPVCVHLSHLMCPLPCPPHWPVCALQPLFDQLWTVMTDPSSERWVSTGSWHLTISSDHCWTIGTLICLLTFYFWTVSVV